MFLNHITYSFVYSVNDLSRLTQPADLQLLQQQNTLQPGQTSAQSEAQSAEQFYDIGVEFHHTGQIDAAIRAYQNAIQRDPRFDSAYINLGLAFIQLGQLEDAKDVLQQVLTLPDRLETPASVHTLAHYNLAIILERQGKPDEAIIEVQSALAITPNFELAQRLLQRLR
ncbi:MAG: tetratricopeptide repeat protein [Elainella sp. C42_A2020_010]|nr:tetratricopeptide repeat protein [Elainella sp. C42_A2020_010]